MSYTLEMSMDQIFFGPDTTATGAGFLKHAHIRPKNLFKSPAQPLTRKFRLPKNIIKISAQTSL